MAAKQTPLTIGLERYEMRVLKGEAYRQLRTPENLAKFLVLKGLGILPPDKDTETSIDTESPEK